MYASSKLVRSINVLSLVFDSRPMEAPLRSQQRQNRCDRTTESGTDGKRSARYNRSALDAEAHSSETCTCARVVVTEKSCALKNCYLIIIKKNYVKMYVKVYVLCLFLGLSAANKENLTWGKSEI